MLKRLVMLCGMFIALAATPATGLAEDNPNIDARVQAYGPDAKVALTDASSNTAASVILLAFLTILGMSVIFKTSKRSHLD